MILTLLPAIIGIFKLIAPQAGGVIGSIFGDLTRGKITEAEAEAKIIAALASAEAEIAKNKADIIQAEIKSEDWITRTWRPMVALTAFFSYWYVIVLYPHLFAWGIMPKLGFGEAGLENLFYLTIVCVGGYITGRSIEKIATRFSR